MTKRSHLIHDRNMSAGSMTCDGLHRAPHCTWRSKFVGAVATIALLFSNQETHAGLYANGTSRQDTLDYGAQFSGIALSLRINVPGLGSGVRNASATFLSHNPETGYSYAITSAHNLTDLISFITTLEIADGLNYINNRGTVSNVVSYTIYPGYDGSMHTLDLALIKYQSTGSAVPNMRIASIELGDLTLASGYGTYATPTTTSFRDGGLGAWQANVTNFFNTQDLDSNLYFTTAFGLQNAGLILNARALSGDSGGPILDQYFRLVGINDSGNSSIGPSGFTNGVRIAAAEAWLISQGAYIASPPPALPSLTCTLTTTAAELIFSNLVPTREYKVMRSSTLSEWAEAQRFTATATTGSWSEARASGGIMFYRLEWNE